MQNNCLQMAVTMLIALELLTKVMISFARVILNSIRPRVEVLGRIQGSDIFCNIRQCPIAARIPSLPIIHIDTSFLCFMNANFTRERIARWVKNDQEAAENAKEKIQSMVMDLSNVMNIDPSKIAALREIHRKLASLYIQLAIANPRWHVIHKMKLAGLVDRIGGAWIFL